MNMQLGLCLCLCVCVRAYLSLCTVAQVCECVCQFLCWRPVAAYMSMKGAAFTTDSAERAGGGLSWLDRARSGRWMLFMVSKIDARCLFIHVCI